MSDLISRQAAIDALRKLREEDIEDYGCEIPEGFNQDHLDRATFAIKQLPPIQPNLLQPWEVLVAQAVLPQPEIVRCKDCKYARLTNDGSCKYCDIWFPDEAEYMDGDYYCASAERKSNG